MEFLTLEEKNTFYVILKTRLKKSNYSGVILIRKNLMMLHEPQLFLTLHYNPNIIFPYIFQTRLFEFLAVNLTRLEMTET